MKRTIKYTPVLFVPLLLALVAAPKRADHAAVDTDAVITSRAEYWRVHAYVNLRYMQYKVDLLTGETSRGVATNSNK